MSPYTTRTGSIGNENFISESSHTSRAIYHDHLIDTKTRGGGSIGPKDMEEEKSLPFSPIDALPTLERKLSASNKVDTIIDIPLYYGKVNSSRSPPFRFSTWIRRNQRVFHILGFLIILILFLFIIIYFCMIYHHDPPPKEPFIPSKQFQSANELMLGPPPRHLIIIPGHAIYLGIDEGNCDVKILDAESNAFLRNGWVLQETYQLDQIPHYMAHIKAGVQALVADPQALLVFSGGQTRKYAGPISEAASNFMFAIRQNWFGYADREPQKHCLLEEFARDSYENVLFSVCRFFQYTGTNPEKITVVGFPFKQKRILEHIRTINLVKEMQYKSVVVNVVTTDDIYIKSSNGTSSIGYTSVNAKENQWVNDPNASYRDSALADFLVDKYGCGKKLSEKRKSRNPFNNVHAYKTSAPHMIPYFGGCS